MKQKKQDHTNIKQIWHFYVHKLQKNIVMDTAYCVNK